MRKVVDAYLAIYLIGSVAIVVAFTAASAVPPRWFLAMFLPFLLFALAGVLWGIRARSLVEEVPADRPLELGD
jgi:hypothetical protein